MTSKGYNMSSDDTCNFSNSGDRNNINPMLGPLQYNGGPTQTMALPSGSPAIDKGKPSDCTDGSGHLLTTDQRDNRVQIRRTRSAATRVRMKGRAMLLLIVNVPPLEMPPPLAEQSPRLEQRTKFLLMVLLRIVTVRR